MCSGRVVTVAHAETINQTRTAHAASIQTAIHTALSRRRDRRRALPVVTVLVRAQPTRVDVAVLVAAAAGVVQHAIAAVPVLVQQLVRLTAVAVTIGRTAAAVTHVAVLARVASVALTLLCHAVAATVARARRRVTEVAVHARVDGRWLDEIGGLTHGLCKRGNDATGVSTNARHCACACATAL